MATSRSKRRSRARYTSPMPPAPSRERIWKSPNLVPLVSSRRARGADFGKLGKSAEFRAPVLACSCATMRDWISSRREGSAQASLEGRAAGGIQFQGGRQNGLGALPVFWCHKRASLRLISRSNQARAVAHSRFTVVREMPITSAVSSIGRPAKKRISTIRLCCGSRRASSFRALSSAINPHWELFAWPWLR